MMLDKKYKQMLEQANRQDPHDYQKNIELLQQNLKVFTTLDAEFEKYFNEYEQMGKLQRLKEKNPADVMSYFLDLIEKTLRVDYNVKDTFLPSVVPRLHSFQWN